MVVNLKCQYIGYSNTNSAEEGYGLHQHNKPNTNF